MHLDARRGIRLLFASSVVLFVLQMAFIYKLKAEPYPALTMPGFAGHPSAEGLIERDVPLIDVQFADGHTELIPFQDILPLTKVVTGNVVGKEFHNDRFVDEPQTIAWLRHRIELLHPGQALTGIDVVWLTVRYDVYSGNEVDRTPSKTTHLEFGGGREPTQ